MRRLSLSLLAAVLLASIGLGWAIDRLFTAAYPDAQDSTAPYLAIGQSLSRSLDGTASLQATIDNWDTQNPVKLGLVNSSSIPLPHELREQLERGESLTLQSDKGLTLYFPMPKSGQLLTMALPPDNGASTNQRLAFTLLFYLGTALLLSIWLYPLLRKLQRMRLAAMRFGDGNLNERLPTHPRSNLHDIESSFNEMATRIEQLVGDNKLLTRAVSHDLRTPLARLRFGIEVLQETNQPSLQREYQARIDADIASMEHLVNMLLDYARLDQTLSNLPLSRIDLNSLVLNSVNSVSRPSQRNNIETVLTPLDGYIMANNQFAKMLIDNLVQNALTHGNSMTRVSTTTIGKQVWLIVEDNGPGIPEDQRADVLKPFVRGKAAEANKATKSVGMGLAIADRIAQCHSAPIEIEQSETLGGARIAVGFQRSSSVESASNKPKPQN